MKVRRLPYAQGRMDSCFLSFQPRTGEGHSHLTPWSNMSNAFLNCDEVLGGPKPGQTWQAHQATPAPAVAATPLLHRVSEPAAQGAATKGCAGGPRTGAAATSQAVAFAPAHTAGSRKDPPASAVSGDETLLLAEAGPVLAAAWHCLLWWWMGRTLCCWFRGF